MCTIRPAQRGIATLLSPPPPSSLTSEACLFGAALKEHVWFHSRGHGSETEHFCAEGAREACRGVVVETYCCPMNRSLGTLFLFPRRRKEAKHQARGANLCPENFEIIKSEQAHWMPSISISHSQSLKTGR